MTSLFGGRARWVALGAVVVALAMGGIAWADIPDSGVIHGCYKTVGGGLRVIDSDQGVQCNASESPLNWNQAGVTGPTGTKGATGMTGPAGPTGAASTSVFERTVDFGDVPNDSATIGSLPLPAGKFLITAKLEVFPASVSDTDAFWDVECFLVAQGDSDHAAEADDTSDFHFSREGTMTMMVTHEFTDPGSAHVDCFDSGDRSGPSDADFASLVITAIGAGDIQHP
jgi:hypothetical protein